MRPLNPFGVHYNLQHIPAGRAFEFGGERLPVSLRVADHLPYPGSRLLHFRL